MGNSARGANDDFLTDCTGRPRMPTLYAIGVYRKTPCTRAAGLVNHPDAPGANHIVADQTYAPNKRRERTFMISTSKNPPSCLAIHTERRQACISSAIKLAKASRSARVQGPRSSETLLEFSDAEQAANLITTRIIRICGLEPESTAARAATVTSATFISTAPIRGSHRPALQWRLH